MCPGFCMVFISGSLWMLLFFSPGNHEWLSPPLSAKAAKVPLEIHDAQGWAAEGALLSSLPQTML